MTQEASRRILWGILGGVVLAFVGVGLLGPAMAPVGVLGELFLRALRQLVVPLVVVSVLLGMTRLGDLRQVGGITGRTLAYYAITTAFSVALGLLLVSVFQPGAGMGAIQEADPALMGKLEAKRELGLSDIILSLFSTNIIQALAEGQMLPVIVFSLIFGGLLTTIGDQAKPLTDVLEAINTVIMKFVHLLMWVAPIGIFGLVGGKFGAAAGDGTLGTTLLALGKYMAVVLAGLALHGTVTLSALCYTLGKRSPWQLMVAMGPALITAWSTASSSATLPLTLDCATERAKIQPRVNGFVLPLGATINMDGTALYEAVAAVFIAQAFGIELSGVQLVLVFITATLVSIGAAGIPEAGLFMMVIVLEAVGLPLEGIGLIFAVDWFLDRFRTMINVWGDSVGAALVDRWTGPAGV